MKSLVIYTCSKALCNRLQLSALQLAVIGTAFVVLLVLIYFIVVFDKIKTVPGDTVFLPSPDPETDMLRTQYTLEEYTRFLNWQMQMGIISFMEYDDLFAKGLPFLR